MHNPNWLGTVCAGAALAMFFLCHRRALRIPMRRRWKLSTVSLVLAIPGASFAGFYAHAFPEPSWYYEFRSWPGTEGLLVALGVAGGLVSSLLPRVLQSLPLIGVAVFAITPVMKPFIAPLPEGILHDEWTDGVCLQSTPSTCGPAAAATILRFLGLAETEADMSRDAHSYAGGTEAWYLARALRKRGYHTHFRFSVGLDPEAQFPAVVGVRLGNVGHFIAILSQEGGRYWIGDPLIGPEILSHAELLARYQFTGFHLSISKGTPTARPKFAAMQRTELGRAFSANFTSLQ